MQSTTQLAVVLCGGESKRMGADKGLLPHADTIRAVHVANKLETFRLPVVFSVNEKQVPEYAAYISPDKLIADSVEAHGPLKGLLSVHQKFPESHLLLLSCDILDLDKETISGVIAAHDESPEYDFVVYQDVNYAQPFCGIYSPQGLSKVLVKMYAHQLHTFSLQSVLDEGHTKRLPIIRPDVFKNYNES